jgi:ribonuclease VapC
MTITAVLDASALLPHLLLETGGEKVRGALPCMAMSAVNLCEVLNRYAKDNSLEKTMELESELRAELGSVEPFTSEDAIAATAIYASSRHLGLSLGDCICLALGQNLGVDVWTCDRTWAQLDASYRVKVIR